MGLRHFRSEFARERRWVYLAFDGQTYVLDCSSERLRRDLPLVAEVAGTMRTPAERRKVAHGLIYMLNVSRGSGYGDFDFVSDGPLLKAKSTPSYLLPHVLWPASAPSLRGRLDVTAHLLASWHLHQSPLQCLSRRYTRPPKCY